MLLREVHPTAHEYLDVVTRLLQRARVAEPTGGLWEAADLQWWWRIDQHIDPHLQAVWFAGDTPVVAAVATQWSWGRGYDLLGSDVEVTAHSAVLWRFVASMLGDSAADMMIRDDDETRIAASEQAGFRVAETTYTTAWLGAADRPAVASLPTGYTLHSHDGGEHPMAGRNGADVARRLAECSLYKDDLDLVIRAGDGTVAGYALFWADPITGVGLVEPMRVEEEHQGRGLASVLLATGLQRLANAGCTRLKVTYSAANEAARRLYTGAGFCPTSTARSYVRGSTT